MFENSVIGPNDKGDLILNSVFRFVDERSLFSILCVNNFIVDFFHFSLWLLFSLRFLFLALCARLHDFSIEHIFHLHSLYYCFLSEARSKKFLVMMICQPILFWL